MYFIYNSYNNKWKRFNTERRVREYIRCWNLSHINKYILRIQILDTNELPRRIFKAQSWVKRSTNIIKNILRLKLKGDKNDKSIRKV